MMKMFHAIQATVIRTHFKVKSWFNSSLEKCYLKEVAHGHYVVDPVLICAKEARNEEHQVSDVRKDHSVHEAGEIEE